jgi:alpha/beta superfamily hydrolase
VTHETAIGVVNESVHFPSGPYRLEGELAYAEDVKTPIAKVVLAGPHPLLGGNMHNNVVRALGDGLAERSMLTLRFDYRGVGRSQGPAVDVAQHMAQFWETSHVPDEMDLWQDVQAGCEFMRPLAADTTAEVLIGYSFGCVLLPRVQCPAPPVYILIAPPLHKHDGQAMLGLRGPVLVIASDDDFAADSRLVRQWFDRLSQPKSLIQATLDNHFFRGHESWLVDVVCAFLVAQGRIDP